MKRLAVSNIAWNPEEEEEIFSYLKGAHVGGIEVAPTKFWPDWVGADLGNCQVARKKIHAAGFEIPTLQAILFGLPELNIFGDRKTREATLAHIDRVANIARELGAKCLVFGSPGNRDRGELGADIAFENAIEFFTIAGEHCTRANVQLCIEPNPPAYGCNFLTTWQEASRFVRTVNHPGIMLNLDTACIHMAGGNPCDAINECIDITAHFHVSEPNLSDFSNPLIDHALIGKTLSQSEYSGWVSIEMRRSDNPLFSTTDAVEKVTDWYFA